MIRHHVLIVLDEELGASKAAVADQIVAELAAYAPTCAELRTFHVGSDIGLSPGAADVAVVAEFDNVDDYNAYAVDPAHVDIIERLILPNAAQRLRTQTEF